MPDVPYPITAENSEDLKRQIWELIREIFEERIGGLNIGDVFVDSGGVLTLNLTASTSGLQKIANALQVEVKTAGGLQATSTGLAAKLKSAGGLDVDSGGVFVTGGGYGFGTIAPTSGTTPVADAINDTLTLTAGAGVSITGNSTTDTVTFANTDGGAGAVASHVLESDPHTGYRLESADHSHATTGAQAGQLDHGGSMVAASLLDDDHTIYTKKATLTEQGDIYYASAASTPAALAHGTAGNLLKTGGDAANPSWSSTVLTEAANAINLTNGTGSIDIAAGKAVDINANLTVSGVTNIVGALDVATGKTVNIDDDVTVAAEFHVESATHVNQDLTSDAQPTFAQLAGLGAPDANGEAIRATAKITEVLLESATDLKHAVGDSISATISDGDLTHSPDGNSVFDALALKAPLTSPSFTTPDINVATADSVTITGAVYWASAAVMADGASVTLPAITANYPANGVVTLAHASDGSIVGEAHFFFGSSGVVQITEGTTATIEANGATAGKVSLGAAVSANPVVIKNNLGGGVSVNAMITLWYH